MDEQLILIKSENGKGIGIYNLKGSNIELLSESENSTANIGILQKFNSENILCISKFEDFTKTFLITSKILKGKIDFLFPNQNITYLFADENINRLGIVEEEFSEANVNILLKQIYATKIKTVAVHLVNGLKNPVHEKILYNVLSVAGYKVFLSGDCWEESLRH